MMMAETCTCLLFSFSGRFVLCWFLVCVGFLSLVSGLWFLVSGLWSLEAQSVCCRAGRLYTWGGGFSNKPVTGHGSGSDQSTPKLVRASVAFFASVASFALALALVFVSLFLSH